MQEITQEYLKSLFTYRDGFLYWKVRKNNSIKIGDKAGNLNKLTQYCSIRINYKSYYNHRIIYLYHHGYLPKYIDHIDRDKLNNKIENLRSVTNSENKMNSISHKDSISKYKGVSWDKNRNKWVAQIYINKNQKYLGLFISETDAALAYNTAAIKYFKEYAHLNGV